MSLVLLILGLFAWSERYPIYLYFKIATSIGTEQQFYESELGLYQTKGALRIPMLFRRMHASLDLGFPIEGVLADYAEAQKLCAKRCTLDDKLPGLAENFAVHGYHQHCILIFEELLVATNNPKTTEADYIEFQKSLVHVGKSELTFKKFQDRWPDAWASVRETYVLFLSTTRNPLARNPKRALEIAQELAAKGSTPLRLQRLASALAATGNFQQATQALAKAEQLYLEAYPGTRSTSEKPDSFLDGLDSERIMFTSGKIVLSVRY